MWTGWHTAANADSRWISDVAAYVYTNLCGITHLHYATHTHTDCLTNLAAHTLKVASNRLNDTHHGSDGPP